MEQQAKVPVTVLTGFLGAGKTTLLNGFVANFDGLFPYSPDGGEAFAKSSRQETLYDP